MHVSSSKERNNLMKIELNEIPIRDLVNGYEDKGENGVIAYGGLLDVRPPYQREFVYKDKQRDAVLDTVIRNFPLNIMYWVKTGQNEDGKDMYEILDGQQRTISICQYLTGIFSMNYKFFHSIEPDKQEQMLNYKLMVYICEGTDSEKLDWFKTVNIAGEKLTDQELRNAVYAGSWLSDAKKYFSRINGPADGLADKYMSGSLVRQEYLETALKWITNDKIEEYMSQHQHDKNANELWAYFNRVINWVEMLFPAKYYRKEMKGIEWGYLYDEYHTNSYDAEDLEERVKPLMIDDEVKAKKGIYYYVFSGDQKHLNLRTFTPQQKREAYEKQDGNCANCGNSFDLSEMEADHIDPWSQGGKTIPGNCQMLCRQCNRRKSAT